MAKRLVWNIGITINIALYTNQLYFPHFEYVSWPCLKLTHLKGKVPQENAFGA